MHAFNSLMHEVCLIFNCVVLRYKEQIKKAWIPLTGCNRSHCREEQQMMKIWSSHLCLLRYGLIYKSSTTVFMDITIPWWTGKIKLHQGDFVNSVQYLLLIPTQASLKLSFLVCPSIKMRLSYTAWVGSQDVFKAGRALNNSKTYSTDEVREMSVGKIIGPSEII